MEQSGRSFRPTFQAAASIIPQLIKLMPHPVPHIILSATLRKSDEDTVPQLLGDMQPNVLCGPMGRRNLLYMTRVTGSESTSLKTSAQGWLTGDPMKQHIWFTHSKKNAEGALLVTAETLLEEHNRLSGINSIAHSFTGGDGIMMKTTTMDAIMNFENLDGEGTVLDPTMISNTTASSSASNNVTSTASNADDVIHLPKIQILVGTKSIQCGVSGDHIAHGFKKGLPSSLYEAVQKFPQV